MVRIFDITDEAKPMGVSTWTVPEDSGNFCTAGRTLRHAFFERKLHADLLQPGAVHRAFQRRVFARSTFAIPTGRRRSAITSRRSPPTPTSAASGDVCKVAIQTNNVEVDDRGYIYAVDRANTGMHILELTGPARQAANFPR